MAHSQCIWVWVPWGSVTKDKRITIIDRPPLRKKFKQNRSSKNWYKYKTLRSKCANLLKKTKKDYFVKVDVENNRSCN